MLRCLRAGPGGEAAIRHVLANASWWCGSFRGFGAQQIQDPGAEKCWQVSSLGRVCDSRGVISYGSLQPSGYRSARIEGTAFFVHRLVAFQFLGPPPSEDAWQVHHKDGKRGNNRLDNLEYVTCSQNTLHAFERKAGPGRPRPVKWRCSGSSHWTTCESIQLAAKHLGLCAHTVSKYCRSGAAVKGLELCFADSMSFLKGEEWRQMCDPETGASIVGRMVSSYGRIRSQNGQLTSGCLLENGYRTTSIRLSSGQRCNRLVHRLVAFAFFGAPPTPEHTQVNHKDRNKGHNAVSNLEYATPLTNTRHFWATGGRRASHKTKPVESRPQSSKEKWTWHSSVSKAAAALKVHAQNISMCLSGTRRATGKLEFRQAPNALLPGEQWQKVDVAALLHERAGRTTA